MAWVMPSRPGKRGGLEHVIASLPEVQDWLDEYILEAASKAQNILTDIRAAPGYTGSWDATIDIEQGDIDRYLILDDKAAMAIEFGRATERIKGRDGSEKVIDGTTPALILHRAIGLKRSMRKRVKIR